jgi:hypothetical protein
LRREGPIAIGHEDAEHHIYQASMRHQIVREKRAVRDQGMLQTRDALDFPCRRVDVVDQGIGLEIGE